MIEDAIRIEVADDLALNLRTWGPGRSRLLLIHGFGHGGFVWRSLAAAMPGVGMAAIDLRGHGDSDHDRSQRYGIDAYVADMVAVAESLDLDDYVLVGHSLGAAIALLARARLPRPPRAIVLVDGGPGLSASASAYIREEFLHQRLRYRSPAEYEADLHNSMPLAASTSLRALSKDALRELGPGEFRLKADRGLGYQKQGDSIDARLWDAIDRTDVPLLVIRGAASSLCSKRWCDDLTARAPHATVETVERAGHAVMLDNPAQFNALVERYVTHWLAEAETPTPIAKRRNQPCSGTR